VEGRRLLGVQGEVVDQAFVGFFWLLVGLEDGFEWDLYIRFDLFWEFDDLFAPLFKDGLIIKINHNFSFHIKFLKHLLTRTLT
jgi:hypothetical protein